MPANPETTALSPRALRRHLGARGYREAITYSFVDPKLQQLFDPELQPVALSNPISADMAVMRTSLLPGLVTAVLRNTNRQQPRVRMFETGLRFVPGKNRGCGRCRPWHCGRPGSAFASPGPVPADGGRLLRPEGGPGEPAGADQGARSSFEFKAGPARGAAPRADCNDS